MPRFETVTVNNSVDAAREEERGGVERKDGQLASTVLTKRNKSFNELEYFPLSALRGDERARAIPFSRSFGSLQFFSPALFFFFSPPSASVLTATHKSLRKICQVEQNEAIARKRSQTTRRGAARRQQERPGEKGRRRSGWLASWLVGLEVMGG